MNKPANVSFLSAQSSGAVSRAATIVRVCLAAFGKRRDSEGQSEVHE